MPRQYTKKTNRDFRPECMKQAVIDVMHNNMSYRTSAEKNGVKKSRLGTYVNHARENGLENMDFSPDFHKSQIFDNDMENALADYLLKCSAIFYGLTPNSARRLAYEYALKNFRKMPETWKMNKMAGKDWFWAFLKRHRRLSVRKPEATSLARMTSFNPTNVNTFQDKLSQVMGRHSFEPMNIYNLDEVRNFL